MRKILIRLSIVAILAIGVLMYFFAFKLKQSKPFLVPLIKYSEEGFIEGDTLTNTRKLAASNANFELYLNETTSHFEVVDKRSGEVWQSNPTIEDPWTEVGSGKFITTGAKEKQLATLELTYFNEAGSSTSINNYRLSIHHAKTTLYEEGKRTFKVKYIDGGFQILYRIADLEIDHLYFPRYLTQEDMENVPSAYRSYLQSYVYNYDRSKDIFYIENYKNMSLLVRKELYNIFYNKMDYTRERAIEENAKHGYFESADKVSFDIAAQVTITEKGFETAIIHDSIKEPKSIKIANISLYPMLGTAVAIKEGVPTKGYLVIPDGSGAVIDFNNEKEFANPYRKRVYGSDIAQLPYKMSEEQEDIHIPLYGMVKENAGFAAIINEGEAMAFINADTSNRIDSYNKIYPTFQLRENEPYILGSGWRQYAINLWTLDRVRTDFKVHYILLNGLDNNYVGIAKAYQNYLQEHHGFKPHTLIKKPNLTTEMLGAYDNKAFFLGIPYQTTNTLTTFKQAQKIVENLKDDTYDMNVIYKGAMNGGLKSSVQTKANIENKLGGRSGYKKLEKKLKEDNIDLYLAVNIIQASEFGRALEQYNYAATRLDGKHAKVFNYHIPSRLPYSETKYNHSSDDYAINPLYYETVYKHLVKSLPTENIYLQGIGSTLTGSYRKYGSVYKQDAVNIHENILEKEGINKIIRAPYGYAFPYASFVTDLPTGTTLYSIIDDHIPLIQLVLAGYIDYSSRSINLETTRSNQFNFLSLLETGSHLKYTLSHDDPKELINSDYNIYLSTYFTNWEDIIKNQLAELNQLKLYSGYLVNHERKAPNVYKVTYSSGLELYINYNLSPVHIEGKTIDALNYIVSNPATLSVEGGISWLI